MKKAIVMILLLCSLTGWTQEQKAEVVVQQQVEAYNRRDLEAFLSFYAEDVKVYTFPNKLTTDGKAALRESYATFFKKATVLDCKITKRIVKNDIVIDEESVQFNDIKFSGVAIYEVKNNKIVSVTFIE